MIEYPIVIGPLAEEELNELRGYDHRAIRDAIAVYLTHEPLRVGSWRVFYVVTDRTVFVLRVVRKGRQTTGQP